MEPQYLPKGERKPDLQYKEMLEQIRNSPETFLMKHTHQARGRYVNLDTNNLVYYFRNGFPVCTERKISFWKKPITELILFMHGVHTLEEMIIGGCDWWREWGSPEQCAKFNLVPGELGSRAFYGPVLAKYPHFAWNNGPECWEYKPFNQIENLVQSLKDGPNLNGHVITTWLPPLAMQHSKLKREVVVAPCHGTVIQVTVIGGKKLALTMVQRSGDVPVGVVSNIIQYATFCIMLAHVCRYEPYKYVHKINDAQIYENQTEYVDRLLERPAFPFPTIHLTEEGQRVNNIFDFTADHFELREYESHSAMRIPYTL